MWMNIDDTSPLISYDSHASHITKDSDTADSHVSLDDEAKPIYTFNTVTRSHARGPFAFFDFFGTSVTVYGGNPRASVGWDNWWNTGGDTKEGRGFYTITLNNTTMTNRPSRAQRTQENPILWESGSIGDGIPGNHRLVIENFSHELWIDSITWTTGSSFKTSETHMWSDVGTFDYKPFDQWTLGKITGGGRTNASNSASIITFNGEGIELYRSMGPNHGFFSVSLDGTAGRRLDAQAPITREPVLLYCDTNLAPGPHEIRVVHLPNIPGQILALNLSRYIEKQLEQTRHKF